MITIILAILIIIKIIIILMNIKNYDHSLGLQATPLLWLICIKCSHLSNNLCKTSDWAGERISQWVSQFVMQTVILYVRWSVSQSASLSQSVHQSVSLSQWISAPLYPPICYQLGSHLNQQFSRFLYNVWCLVEPHA